MNDDDLMPFGMHEGKRLCDVPAEYLLYLLDNNKCYGDIRNYIIDVKDALIAEVKQNKTY